MLHVQRRLFITRAGCAAAVLAAGASCSVPTPSWAQGTAADAVVPPGAFDNPDFVDIVIHSYRHRFANAPGDPRYGAVEAELAQPRIGVPTIAIHGEVDGVAPPEKSEGHSRYFTGLYERRLFANVGHNPPQEAPEAFATAILALCRSH